MPTPALPLGGWPASGGLLPTSVTQDSNGTYLSKFQNQSFVQTVSAHPVSVGSQSHSDSQSPESPVTCILIVVCGSLGYKMKKRVGAIEEFTFLPLTEGKQLHITIAITGWLASGKYREDQGPGWGCALAELGQTPA